MHAAAGEYVTTYAVPRGHARARGSPRCYFAAESHTDIRAREMGIDPLGFRLLNAERSSEFADQVDEQLRKVVDRAVGCLQLGYAAVIVARASNGSW